MIHILREIPHSTFNERQLLTYVADLELEVDRLRKQATFVQQEVRATLKRLQLLSGNGTSNAPKLAEIDRETQQLTEVLRDVQEPPGYHPAHDQVIALAMRPLLEQVFRAQQRLVGATNVALRLELESEYLEWFPARLRHILENLISNALKYRDPSKDQSWVCVGLRDVPDGYELRVSDNGLGLPDGRADQVLDLYFRAAPTRAAGLGVGLAVVQLLVERSGGTLAVDTTEGRGTTFVAILPRYDVNDYLL
jgi:signal transduction histidine kinase